MRGNLQRYALWQMRDFARDRGIALLLVGFLIGFTVVGPLKAVGRTIDDGDTVGETLKLVEIVRSDDYCPPRSSQPLDNSAEPLSPYGVEPVRRFVENHHRLIAEQ